MGKFKLFPFTPILLAGLLLILFSYIGPVKLSTMTSPLRQNITPTRKIVIDPNDPPTPTPTRIPDYTPPQTEFIPNGDEGREGWYQSVITGVFQATDNLAVALIFYRLDEKGEFLEVQENLEKIEDRFIILSEEGQYSLEFYSMDYLGNTESVQTTTIKIDKSSPMVTLSPMPSPVYTGCITSTYFITDTVSGLSRVMTVLNNQPVHIETGLHFKSLSPGPHVVSITATDQAGWMTIFQHTFNLVATEPTLVCTNHQVTKTSRAITGELTIFLPIIVKL